VSGDLSGFSLYDLFRTEAETQTAILSEGLLSLESRGGTSEVIEPLMRAAHSLKGAARIVGMTAAEQLSHALEDVFVAAQKGGLVLGSDQIDALLASVDMLSEVSRLDEDTVESWRSTNGERLDAQIATLKAIHAGTWKPPATKSAPERATAAPTMPRPEAGRPPGDAPAGRAALAGRKPKARKARATNETAAPIPPAPPPQAGTQDQPIDVQPTAPAAAGESAQRVVRVTAENLNRLMGLAGESLVQARQLRPLVDGLEQVRQAQNLLLDGLRSLEEALTSLPDDAIGQRREVFESAKHRSARLAQMLGERIVRLEDHARRGEELSERLHFEVISSRLRPLIDGVRGFPRLVRDTARELGKDVRFEIVGEQTGVDRDILEKLEAPLNHLIRNALDHGIETPEERRAAAKPATATIRLEARHVAGMLQIRLSDDGRGIVPERIRAKVIERKLASEAMAAQMTAAELLEFLFLPGFSTKQQVTAISGRGVGLDIVQSMVQSVGGTVRVSSQPGSGTVFMMQLPITMSVIRALLVRISGQPYAFPLSRLESIQRVPPDQVETIEGRPFFTLDGEAVGLVAASQVFELADSAPHGHDLPVAVVSDRGHRFGVVVDDFLGERDLDVRPLDPRLGKVPNINSASVLEDGWPVLIIDVEDLVRSTDNLLHGRRFKMPAPDESTGEVIKAAKRVLVVDDSVTVRELERQLLASHGYQVDVAVDGMDGWNAVRSVGYDLVVSDVDMPRMDGIEMVTRIKQDPKLRSLPVIIVSYKDREEDRIRGLDAGASSYLTKSSFHDESFLQTVADLIGGALE
jgi:two-component system sensor histidine kinase and response regulator WspE